MLLVDHPERPLEWKDLRVLFAGGYWMGENDLVRVYLDSLKDLGVQVFEYSTDEHRASLDLRGRPYDYGRFGPVYLAYDAVEPILQDFKPHIILCCAGGLAFTPAVSAMLRRSHCLLGMALSDPDVFEPSTQFIARDFDVYTTNSLAAVARYRGIGVNAFWSPFACFPRYHRKLPPTPEYECDVLFIGQARPDRIALVKSIASQFHTRIFGTGWNAFEVPNKGRIPGDRVVDAVNSARVCLDFARNLAGDYMVKYRVFEFAGCGALVCTEEFPELGLHFRYGEEILGYRSEEELTGTLRTCLDDEERRNRLRQNAYERSRSEHTFAHRWRTLFEACGARLPEMLFRW